MKIYRFDSDIGKSIEHYNRWHGSGTEKGLTAMIIEARKIHPAELMPPV